MHGSQVKLYPHTVAPCTLRHRLKYIIGSTIIATMSSSDYSRMPDRGYMCALSRGATRAALVWLSFLSYTLRSLALRAVVADTKELRIVPYDTALPVLFIREQTWMGGFEPAVGYGFFYLQCPGCLSFSFMLQGTPSTTQFSKNGAS